MSETNQYCQPSTSQSLDDKGKVTCHLVAMPKLILTRIDEGKLPISIYSSPTVKKPVKRLTGTKTKSLSLTASPKKASSVKSSIRTKAKAKKDVVLSKVSKTQKKVANSKLFSKVVTPVKKAPQKTPSKQNKTPESNSVKGMLKKTMLQKRSKIVIPPAKKRKLSSDKPVKTTPIPPKTKKISPIKIDVPPNKATDTDSSEDEFLYDEFIEELENVPGKKINSTSLQLNEKSDLTLTKTQEGKTTTKDVKTKHEDIKTGNLPDVEKTKVITLKPNSGNKPPTIVKGGIVKRTNIPADLKSVANPVSLNSNKKIGNSPNPLNKSTSSVSALQNSPNTGTNSAKKASPWPISISSPTKNNPKSKTNSTKINLLTDVKEESIPNTPKGPKKRTKGVSKAKTNVKVDVFQPKVNLARNPKIGPKKVVKVPPLSNTVDGEESDEYTEVETLENTDSEPLESSNMSGTDRKKSEVQEAVITENIEKRISDKSSAEEDPNLDLLRILTDDSDEVLPLSQNDPKEDELKNETKKFNNDVKKTQEHRNGISDTFKTEKSVNKQDGEVFSTIDASNDLVTEPLVSEPVTESSTDDKVSSEPENDNSVEESPPVRTIYELMNDVSLQYPSWNLHIIPETNAFCIAQVTKGRLGLPTLKKCIELDPETYSAKVYIHQYHIKRFDGVYDSEETILALIEEIHSIKA